MEDIHEPLRLFRTVFRPNHRKFLAETFEKLVQDSSIDPSENAKTVATIQRLNEQIQKEVRQNLKLRPLKACAVILGMAAAGLAVYSEQWYLLTVTAAMIAIVVAVLNPIGNQTRHDIKSAERQREALVARAWKQIEPLNRKFTHTLLLETIQSAVPNFAFDDVFTNQRLNELRSNFGWNDIYNYGKSIQCVYSGSVGGNPFLIVKATEHSMGTKTYTGYHTISWLVQVPDGKGRTTTIRQYQTLTASLDKPFPLFQERTSVIFFSDAAPDLCFSRNPNAATSTGPKESNRSQSTPMQENDFDRLFGANDRNHEVQFRLLFTPLAQREMLRLILDKETGYGDDFCFSKSGRVNFIETTHLTNTDISGNPGNYLTFDFSDLKRNFLRYYEETFRSIYFSLAPILAIPIYQNHPPDYEMSENTPDDSPCFWEIESLANRAGEHLFRHPQSVTRNLIKAKKTNENGSSDSFVVSSQGYAGVNHISHATVLGGDGRFHSVPIYWTEYISVQKESTILIRSCDRRPISDQPIDNDVYNPDQYPHQHKSIFARIVS